MQIGPFWNSVWQHGHYHHFSVWHHLCQANGGLAEADERTSWRYYQAGNMRGPNVRDISTLGHANLIRQLRKRLLWSGANQSLGTSLVLKPFDGGNLMKGLMGCLFALVSPHVHIIERDKSRKNCEAMEVQIFIFHWTVKVTVLDETSWLACRKWNCFLNRKVALNFVKGLLFVKYPLFYDLLFWHSDLEIKTFFLINLNWQKFYRQVFFFLVFGFFRKHWTLIRSDHFL